MTKSPKWTKSSDLCQNPWFKEWGRLFCDINTGLIYIKHAKANKHYTKFKVTLCKVSEYIDATYNFDFYSVRFYNYYWCQTRLNSKGAYVYKISGWGRRSCACIWIMSGWGNKKRYTHAPSSCHATLENYHISSWKTFIWKNGQQQFINLVISILTSPSSARFHLTFSDLIPVVNLISQMLSILNMCTNTR